MIRQHLHWILLTCAAAAFGLSGCRDSGPKHWPVVGKVTFQGKPVSEATIRFSNPATGVDVIAKLGPDGAYVVDTARGRGLPEGSYQVDITPIAPVPPGGMLGPPPPLPNRPDIPERYRQTSSSGLSLAVKSDTNTFDVEMLPK